MDFTFYTHSEYFEQVARDVRQTKQGDRVIVTTMDIVVQSQQAAALMDELTAAAKRGVTVSLAVDAHAFLFNGETRLPGPLWFNMNLERKLREPWQSAFHSLQSFEAAGGKLAITNMPRHAFSMIPKGRSHIKAAIVKDKLYIGGCNLDSPEDVDIMVAWRNAAVADWLYNNLVRMVQTGYTHAAFRDKDQAFAFGSAGKIILDAGKPKQSAILDEAYRLIDDAQSWLFMTCQYFPGELTIQKLAAARRRGVRVELIYAHPGAHGAETPGHYLHELRERLRVPSELFAGKLAKDAPYLHAKVLASEQAAMVGSHNYVIQGVNFGTAEIALKRFDPKFSKEIVGFIERQLGRQQ